MISIRAGRASDFETLAGLDSVAATDPGRRTEIADWLAKGHVFLAERSGMPLGYGVVSNSFFHRPMLDMLMVDTRQRRQGAASALLRHAIAQANGPLFASTNASNQPMRRLLAKTGFRPAGMVAGLDAGDPECFYLFDATAALQPQPHPAIAPVLVTERLTLRGQTYADFERLTALYQGERASYIGGRQPPAQVWRNFMNSVGHWPILGMGGWAIDVTASGQCVGEVAVCHPPDYPETELGWALFDGFEGQGYALEAAAAVRDWARNTLRPPSLVSYVDPSNAPSIKLAQRLGGVLDETGATPNGDACLVFRHW